MGHRATGNELGLTVGRRLQRHDEQRRAVPNLIDPPPRRVAAEFTQHAQCDDRLGQRRSGQSAAGLFHHQARIEQAHAAAAHVRRDPHEGRIEFDQLAPEIRIEAHGFGRANARRRGLRGEKTLEHLPYRHAVIRQSKFHSRSPLGAASGLLGS